MAYIFPTPLNPVKGTPLSVELNKNTLLNDPAFQAAADALFKDDTTKWKSVEITMRSTTYKQKETMIFDCDNLDNLVYTDFLISDDARDVWEVDTVVVSDFDGGYVRLSAKDGQVNGLDFNFDLSPPPVASNYYENTFDFGTTPTLYESTSNTNYGSFGSLELLNLGFSTPEFGIRVDELIGGPGNTYVNIAAASPLVVSSFNNLELSLDVTYIAGNFGGMIVDVEITGINGGTFSLPMPTVTNTGVVTLIIPKSQFQTYGISTIGNVKFTFVPNLADWSTAVSIDNLIFTTN
jgi:hypothetical protein